MSHPARSRRGPCFIPKPSEIAVAQQHAGWTDEVCAERICVSLLTWQRWKSGSIAMPAGAWKLFRYEIGWLRP